MLIGCLEKRCSVGGKEGRRQERRCNRSDGSRCALEAAVLSGARGRRIKNESEMLVAVM